MDTEKINAYNQAVAALQAVNNLRTYSNTGTPERADLDQTAMVLEALSWNIISGNIKQDLATLTSKLTGLKALNKKIRDSYADLKAISDIISEAAEVVGTFIEVAEKAIADGII